MKRDLSLARLSRDHHVALVVARRLNRATESDAEDARDAFLTYWQRDGREHFRQEEEILLPGFARFGDPDTPVVAAVLVDHVRVRALAVEITSGTVDLELLHALGALLERHVRREERELFPLIEAAVPQYELQRLAALLDH